MTVPATRPPPLPPLLATLLEALPDAAVVADDAGRIVAVNALAATLFGYRVDELLDQPVECLLPPDLAARHEALRDAYDRAPALRAPRPLRGRRRDGEEFAAEISLNPLEYDDRRLVIAAIRDLSVREALRESLHTRDLELAASRTRLAIMDSAVAALPLPIAIGTVDDLRLEYVNQAFVDQFGYTSADEVVGRPASIVASDPNRQLEVFAEAIAHGAAMSDANGVRRDGSRVPILVALSLLPESADGRSRLVGSFVDLSERERSAELLRQREAQLRAVLDALPLATVLTEAGDDGNDRFVYANREFSALFGYEPGTVPTRQEWSAARFPDPAVRAAMRERATAAFGEARRTHRPMPPIEVAMTAADGVSRQLELTVIPVGERILNVFRDLTEQRRAEARFRSVLDGIAPTTGAAFFASLTHNLRRGLEVDYAFVAAREGEQMEVLAIEGPDGAEERFAFPVAAAPCAERTGCEGCVWASGAPARFRGAGFVERRDVEAFVCQPLASSTGAHLGMLAVMCRAPIADPQPVVDMLRIFAGRAAAEIERDHADRALRALTDDLERRVAERSTEVQWQAAAMDVSTEGITIVRDSYIRYANRSFARLLGFDTAAEVMGHSWSEFHEPDEALRLAALIGPTLLAEGRWRGAATLRRRDGSPVTVEIGLAAGEDSDVISAYRDITERLQMAGELRRGRDELSAANAQLLRAGRAKDEFLAIMSHELRTPLNAVLGISEAMEEEVYGPLTAAQRAALANVGASGRHLLELINDVLDLSKIEAGAMTLDVDAVDVRAACYSTVQVVRERAERKQIELGVSVPADLQTIPADRRRLKQILLNLLDNALKFTAPGGRIALEASRDTERGAVRFTVRDSGIGIAAEALPQIFAPFTQVDRGLDREYAGTGLGLSLVQRLADMHGGSVEVTSAPGHGSTFVVSLPLRSPLAPDLDLEPGAAPPPAAAPEPRAAQGELILIADDNAANATFLRDYLEAIGYRVVLAHDGREAVERTRAEHPALILMDIQMPVLDGLAATRELRADAALGHMPIIACTALAMPGDRERCLAAGADDYLAKPVRLKDLRTVIGGHLGRAAGGSA